MPPPHTSFPSLAVSFVSTVITYFLMPLLLICLHLENILHDITVEVLYQIEKFGSLRDPVGSQDAYFVRGGRRGRVCATLAVRQVACLQHKGKKEACSPLLLWLL